MVTGEQSGRREGEVSRLERWIQISVADQALRLLRGDEPQAEYPVSTARKGVGERHGSHMTPRGCHVIRAKIGAGLPPGAVLIGRRPSGEIFSKELREAYPERLWILSRILWLSGLEPGYNRLGNVDTMRRFVYIHGCPDDTQMGKPGSIGCIEMRNHDVIELFDQVPVGTRVMIS